MEKKGRVDKLTVDRVEMNPQSVHLLQIHVAPEASSCCQFEVTDDGSNGIRLYYQRTAALSCVTTIGSHLPCQTQCCLKPIKQQVRSYHNYQSFLN